MDGWGRGDDGAVAETSMANASRQPAISGKPDHSDRGTLTMVAPVLLLLPPLLCVLLLVAAPSSALPPPPSCCSLLCSAYVLQGVVLATGVGALRSKVAERWYLLYKMDKQGANLTFIYWWEDKITFVGDRTVVEMYKFLKKHAAIPFNSAAAAAGCASASATNCLGEVRIHVRSCEAYQQRVAYYVL
ncbi:uncharacterized protein LOC125509892 isoform X1 [Triticum urartu]|uniref:uncharacterized protein LOC125509892 isoform X1 n=1 Tax=Triticum urartu TaxID=4572 RepID=UPI0020437C24|nr:uncharacterized protein LOC125509892 isoform X1 [Triticum urartu]